MITTTTPLSAPATEHHAVHTTQQTLKYLYGIVPIVAGADKFTNLLVHWENYLHPRIAAMIAPELFMRVVGVIEIVAGILVLLKPRLGGYVVMAWLLVIALQLIAQGRYLDIAVRDIVMALGGALTLAKLTPFEQNDSSATGSSDR